jgi:hypothetical protein
MIFLAATAAFILYVDWAYQPPPQLNEQSYNLASSVASAQDLASLKLACLPLAQNQDAYMDYARLQSISMARFMNRGLWIAVLFCLLCGSMLLYSYLQLRRISASHEL